MAGTFTRTVHSRTAKADDIEIHVSTLEVNGSTYTEIREFVVSLELYGRGVTFPARHTVEVQEGLEDVLAKVGVPQ